MAVSWAQAQAAVIGSALIDARCVPEILADMRPEDFSGEYRSFFDAIAALTAEQTPVDPVTVLSKIGPAYEETARTLIDLTPTAANVRAYIAACREQARLRLLQGLGTELTGAQTLEQAREIAARVMETSMDSARSESVSPLELAAMWINSLNEDKKPEFIYSGINCLDSVVHTRPGHMHIIAGKTSHGKSALAIQIAWNIAQQRKVGYFSNEMPAEDFEERLIAMLSPADHGRVRARELHDDEVQLTGRAAGSISRAGLWYEPAAGMTVDDIRARTLQRGYKVIFVDYLQIVRYPKRGASNYEAVSEISKALATMARSLGIVVFAMSQLSRQDDGSCFEPVPPLSSLRESGQLEQDAESVIFVHAPMRLAYQRFRILDVAKNRSGPIDRFYIDFDVRVQKFSAPSTADYRLWSEVARKRRVLTAEERDAIKAEHEADVKRRLEKEQRKRHDSERRGSEQTVIKEVKA